MQLKKTTCHTSSIRHRISIQKNLLSKFNNIIKNLVQKKKSFGGRNSTGRITIRHQGGGCKKKMHNFFFKQNYLAIVIKTMYNANSNSFVSLNFDLKKRKFFKTYAVKNIFSGFLIKSCTYLKDVKLGYRTNLKSLPAGTIICSVFLKNNLKYARSAGSFCQIVEKKEFNIKLKLPSGALVYVPSDSFATLGTIDNAEQKQVVKGKAGFNRLKGIRPSVRGIAMNPVDHPHGGKSNKGMPQVTPWGLPTKGKPTVKKS